MIEVGSKIAQKVARCPQFAGKNYLRNGRAQPLSRGTRVWRAILPVCWFWSIGEGSKLLHRPLYN